MGDSDLLSGEFFLFGGLDVAVVEVVSVADNIEIWTQWMLHVTLNYHVSAILSCDEPIILTNRNLFIKLLLSNQCVPTSIV